MPVKLIRYGHPLLVCVLVWVGLSVTFSVVCSLIWWCTIHWLATGMEFSEFPLTQHWSLWLDPLALLFLHRCSACQPVSTSRQVVVVLWFVCLLWLSDCSSITCNYGGSQGQGERCLWASVWCVWRSKSLMLWVIHDFKGTLPCAVSIKWPSVAWITKDSSPSQNMVPPLGYSTFFIRSKYCWSKHA